MSLRDPADDIWKALLQAISLLKAIPDAPVPSDLVDQFARRFDELKRVATRKGFLNSRPCGPSSSITQGEAATDQLCLRFLEKQRSPLTPPEAIKDLLCDPIIDSRKNQDLLAVERLLGGVQWAEEETWKGIFSDLSGEMPIYLGLTLQDSMNADSETDLTRRLIKRQLNLCTARSRVTAYRLVVDILTKIDAIRFAADFPTLTAPQKAHWLRSAFLVENHRTYLHLQPPDLEARLQQDRPLFKAWNKQAKKAIRARERLLELYLQYGAMVLLDPAWNLAALENKQVAFTHRVLMQLPARLVGLRPTDPPNSPHPLARLQPNVEHALVCIVEAVAGQEVALHVNDFLDEFQPHSRIPVSPQYA